METIIYVKLWNARKKYTDFMKNEKKILLFIRYLHLYVHFLTTWISFIIYFFNNGDRINTQVIKMKEITFEEIRNNKDPFLGFNTTKFGI